MFLSFPAINFPVTGTTTAKAILLPGPLRRQHPSVSRNTFTFQALSLLQPRSSPPSPTLKRELMPFFALYWVVSREVVTSLGILGMSSSFGLFGRFLVSGSRFSFLVAITGGLDKRERLPSRDQSLAWRRWRDHWPA